LALVEFLAGRDGGGDQLAVVSHVRQIIEVDRAIIPIAAI
jgi:hypothetical protein